jgi:sulfotransferase family protein
VSEQRPIFIGGLSHSGKTQLRIALEANPDLSLTRRTYLWDRFYGRFGDLRDPAAFARCLEALCADEAVAQLSPDPDAIRREVAEGDPSYARVFAAFHRQHAERLGKPRWGEQLGFIERFADPIFAAFPSARMIHMIRDPRSGSAGRRRRPGALGWETARWLSSASLATRNRRRYAKGYLVVRYEALSTEPETTVDAVSAFIGEPMLPAVRERLGEIRFEIGGETRQGSPYAAFVDRYAGGALPAFGYPAGSARLTTRGRLAFQLLDRPINRASMAAWRIFGDGSAVRAEVDA